jgi:CDP-glucose 4,6-dehydratase
MKPNSLFWKDKNVLITGHTGFKGSWLAYWLLKMGAKISGISLEPDNSPNLYDLLDLSNSCQSYFFDIRDNTKLKSIVRKINPDIVIHLAAQSLVLRSYKDPSLTFETNLIGTTNILESLRFVDNTQALLVITTDKVYENKEWNFPYREIDVLGGHDPYSASKAASEIIVDSYKKSFFFNRFPIATARAGNVIGGGDWSEDRLIPDLIRAWSLGKILNVRNRESIRPWQHVIEPLSGYLILIEKLVDNPLLNSAFNFGPELSDESSVDDLLKIATKYLAPKKVKINFGIVEQYHESKILRLDISKSKLELGFKPKWSKEITIEKTINWYKNFYGGKKAIELCGEDLKAYENT